MFKGLFTCLVSFPTAVFALNLGGTVFDFAGKKYEIDPALIYSIAIVESAVVSEQGRDFVNPSPLALRTNKPYYPKTRTEAERLLKNLLKKNKSVDVGLCQVNTMWHGYRVTKLIDLLDAQINANVAAKVISENIERYPNDILMAIGSYHTQNRVRARKYARLVLRVYTKLKEEDGDND